MEGKKETSSDILTRIANQERSKLTSKNEHSGEPDAYGPSHPNALSDGDQKGKGELNGSIGSKSDIKQRTKLTAANIFSRTKPYTGPEE